MYTNESPQIPKARNNLAALPKTEVPDSGISLVPAARTPGLSHSALIEENTQGAITLAELPDLESLVLSIEANSVLEELKERMSKVAVEDLAQKKCQQKVCLLIQRMQSGSPDSATKKALLSELDFLLVFLMRNSRIHVDNRGMASWLIKKGVTVSRWDSEFMALSCQEARALLLNKSWSDSYLHGIINWFIQVNNPDHAAVLDSVLGKGKTNSFRCFGLEDLTKTSLNCLGFFSSIAPMKWLNRQSRI